MRTDVVEIEKVKDQPCANALLKCGHTITVYRVSLSPETWPKTVDCYECDYDHAFDSIPEEI